ncbi:MAG: folate family ECF transporter S component [Eubacteriales bacterium]|nr:folate family ECF transporter S component [Eubacteriales bacterium]
MSVSKSKFTVKRITLNAMLIAMYLVLSYMKLTMGGLQITFAFLPVIICALAFGPVDGLIVGFLAEFLSQILGPYGMTPTTLLWVAPVAVRGLLVGLFAMLVLRSTDIEAYVSDRRHLAVLLAAIVGTGILGSIMNTGVLYVDSKMFGYYSYAMVFGVFWIRIVSGVISHIAMTLVAVPVTVALRKSKLI